jgi:xanthine dehydrogenase iron-sulfur cluster and FAD-binding subunit A
MWRSFLRPTTLADLLGLTAEHGASARLVAGGTDLVVELSRGIRPTETLIDLSVLEELRYLREDGGWIELGALVTHADVLGSELCWRAAWPLVEACREVGAPQIRNRGTIVGNLVTASPANDTIAPLMALGAELVLGSSGGERIVALGEFYPGFRQTVLRPGEVVRAIRMPMLGPEQRGRFVKLGLRRAQAIAVVNLAVVVRLEGETVAQAAVAMGCVAPTVIRSGAAEAYLIGRRLDAETCARAAELAGGDARPIDDLRAPASYRLATLRALLADTLRELPAVGGGAPSFERPVLLAAPDGTPWQRSTLNGRPWRLPGGAERKTLLDALREDAGLTGTKEGCAEGECGACTVWLDGRAVMACLTPAGQATGSSVTTVEGLASADRLHPVQGAFVARGAVQCGYCTPGFVMAAAKLLDEHPTPTEQQILTALSGNVCRCTGYRKIVDAVLEAAETPR